MEINKQEEFKILHEKYGERLLNSMTAVVRDRDAAEDITATAFATALAKRDRFRGDSSLYTWVYAIALNEAKRKRHRTAVLSLDSITGLSAKGLAEPDGLIRTQRDEERRSDLNAALRHLPTKYRQVLVDHFLEGYSVKQIAGRLAFRRGPS